MLADEYAAGPIWHLGVGKAATDWREHNWFDAPAFDHAWWQHERHRVLLYFHDGGTLQFGSLQQPHSQDVDPNLTTFAYRPIVGGRVTRFLSLFVPHPSGTNASELAVQIQTRISAEGEFVASIGQLTMTIQQDGNWSVARHAAGMAP